MATNVSVHCVDSTLHSTDLAVSYQLPDGHPEQIALILRATEHHTSGAAPVFTGDLLLFLNRRHLEDLISGAQEALEGLVQRDWELHRQRQGL